MHCIWVNQKWFYMFELSVETGLIHTLEHKRKNWQVDLYSPRALICFFEFVNCFLMLELF